jgi:hypothetical protein
MPEQPIGEASAGSRVDQQAVEVQLLSGKEGKNSIASASSKSAQHEIMIANDSQDKSAQPQPASAATPLDQPPYVDNDDTEVNYNEDGLPLVGGFNSSEAQQAELSALREMKVAAQEPEIPEKENKRESSWRKVGSMSWRQVEEAEEEEKSKELGYQPVDHADGDASSSSGSFDSVAFEQQMEQKNRRSSVAIRNSAISRGRSPQFVRKIRLFCGHIVEHPKVQIGIIMMIIVNGIMLGIGTYDFVQNNKAASAAFVSIDKFFLIIFTIELVLQLVYRLIMFFSDGWLIFDFFIVVSSWSLESLQIFRSFRIFRAFRLITRIGPLRELVMSIALVMPRMYAIAALLILIFYIFAVLFTELFSELVLSEAYFTTLDASLFTCMELMTLEWIGIARQVMDQISWAWLPFLVFIMLTGFIVFNLIIAVVCDAVQLVDKEIKAENTGSEATEFFDTDTVYETRVRVEEIEQEITSMRKNQAELQTFVKALLDELSPPRPALTEQEGSSRRVQFVQDGDKEVTC